MVKAVGLDQAQTSSTTCNKKPELDTRGSEKLKPKLLRPAVHKPTTRTSPSFFIAREPKNDLISEI